MGLRSIGFALIPALLLAVFAIAVIKIGGNDRDYYGGFSPSMGL